MRLERAWPPEITANLNQLLAEIPEAPLRPLPDRAAADAAAWDVYLAPFLGQSWYEAPWIVVEAYLFRRILAAIHYFDDLPNSAIDPYANQKRHGVQAAAAALPLLSQETARWHKEGYADRSLAYFLTAALWGNQADLSLWAPEAEDRPEHLGDDRYADQIIVDDTAKVISHLNSKHDHLAMINDNTGLELIADLYLVDFLLGTHVVNQVELHLKAQPTFVSDATMPDVVETLTFLAEAAVPEAQAVGQRLQQHRANGRLHWRSHPFWTSPLSFWEMPADLADLLAKSDLVISKGDANYRRLLGDRHWPLTTPFDQIVNYFPAPLAVLRTCKSEVAVGLSREQVTSLPEQDPHWLTNGRWGMIQFRA